MSRFTAAATLFATIAAWSSAFASQSCVSVAEMIPLALSAPAERIGATSTRSVEFTHVAQCVIEGEVQRSAVLFALPSPPHVQITIATTTHRKKGLMPLVVSRLDAELRTISRHDSSEFDQRGTSQTLSFRRQAQRPDHYLLIEPDLDRMGSSGSLVSGVRMTTVWVAAGFMGSFSNGSEKTIAIPFADAGKFEIEITRLDSGASTR